MMQKCLEVLKALTSDGHKAGKRGRGLTTVGIVMCLRCKLVRSLLIIMAATLLAGNSRAEIIAAGEVLSQYGRGGPNEKAIVEAMVLRTEQGMEWMQTYYEVKRNQKRAFCPPEKLVLTGEQILDIMRREIGKVPQLSSSAYEAAILTSLQSVFPCQ